MKILFDQGVPVPLRNALRSHDIDTAYEKGWSLLENGDLLREAEKNLYEVLISTDQNLKYQQNLQNRRIALLILTSTDWRKIKMEVEAIASALRIIAPAGYQEVNIRRD